MKRFILSLGAMAVIFGAMSSPLLAAGHSGGHGGGHASVSHASVSHAHVAHVTAHPSVGHAVVHANVGHGIIHGFHYGVGGYYGRDYRGWRSSYWNAAYGCSWYFNPECNCYYYWYAPWSVFLPVSQIALYPPTVGINIAVP